MSPRIPAITVGTYHLMGGEGRVCNPEETCLGQVPQPHDETREARHPVPPRPPPPGQMAIALWTRGLPCGSGGKESACNAGDPGSIPGSGISAGERTVFWGFPGGSAGKEPACNAGDLGLVPGLGRSPGEGNGHPLQYSGLENSMDCVVPGVTKSRTRLSAFRSH